MSPYFAKAVEEDFENAEERVCEYSPGVSAPVNGMVYWKTSCGKMLDRTADEPPSSTLVDWPYVARHRYCPFCGKVIKVTK